MRYFVISLLSDPQLKYSAEMSVSVPAGVSNLDYVQWEGNNSLLLTVSDAMRWVRSFCEPGDVIHLFPNLPCRRSYRVSANGRVMRLRESSLHITHRDLNWSVLSASEARITFGLVGYYAGYSVECDEYDRYPDPWRMFDDNQAEEVTTTTDDVSFGSFVWDPGTGSIFFDRVHEVALTRPEPLAGYRHCVPGEVQYITCRRWDGDRWVALGSLDIGKKIPSRWHYCTPIGELPEWLEPCSFNSGYRYLRKGEILDRRDVTLKVNTPYQIRSDSRGLVINDDRREFARPIGLDGWRMMEPHEDPFDGAYEYTECQPRGEHDDDWCPVPVERSMLDDSHRVEMFFRRYVFGLTPEVKPSPLTEPPFALEWIPKGGIVYRGGSHFWVGDDGRVAWLDAHRNSWFYAPCDYRFATRSHLPFFNPINEFPLSRVSVVKDLSTYPFEYPYGRYWFLSRFSLTVLGGSGFIKIETSIGTFYPVVFDIDGQHVLVFCSDQISLDRLPSHLESHLAMLRGGVASLVSSTNHDREELLGRHLEI